VDRWWKWWRVGPSNISLVTLRNENLLQAAVALGGKAVMEQIEFERPRRPTSA
jgi:hypothetical protein